MMKTKININTLAAFLGVSYLFIIFHPFILWILPPLLINIPIYFGVILITILLFLNNQIALTRNKLILSLFILVYGVHIILTSSTDGINYGKIFQYISFACIVLFPSEVLFIIFRYFRSMIIFFSAVSILVFLLIFIGIDLPYYKVDGFTLPMIQGNHFFRIYGIVVSSTVTEYHFIGFTIARACGPFLEPGHFAIYLGIVLSIEKLLYNKISKIPIIAGFLTFSPAFVIILISIIVFDIFVNKRTRLLIYVSLFLISLSSILVADKELREIVWFLTIERNLNLGTDAQSILDKRTNKSALIAFKRFLKTEEAFFGKGVENLNERGVLSDYRGLIYSYGFIGLFISILIWIIIFREANLRSILLLIPIVLLIYGHRAWMFGAPYIYLLSILGIQSQIYLQKIKNSDGKIQLK